MTLNILKKFSLKLIKKSFLVDKNSCSIFFEQIIKKNNKIINFNDPIYNLKAIKNRKEIRNIKLAHIYDGAALTKYLFWIKKNFYKKKITEISASKKLLSFRQKKIKNLNFPVFQQYLELDQMEQLFTIKHQRDQIEY